MISSPGSKETVMNNPFAEMMSVLSNETWRAARMALEQAIVLHITDPNVALIDLGFKVKDRDNFRMDPELAVRIHVREKRYGSTFEEFAQRHPHQIFDAKRIGFNVDVPGVNYRLHGQDQMMDFSQNITQKPSSRRCPITGTVVRDRRTGRRMLLCTCHDLSNYTVYHRHALRNHLDAAVVFNGHHDDKVYPASYTTGIIAPQLGMRVCMEGTRPGMSTGIISGILGYGAFHIHGSIHLIGPIIHIAPYRTGGEICAQGDSGKLWLETPASKAVGMHFAGSHCPHWGLALPISAVLHSLDVDLRHSSAEKTKKSIPKALPFKSASETPATVSVVSTQRHQGADLPRQLNLTTSFKLIRRKILFRFLQLISLFIACLVFHQSYDIASSMRMKQDDKLRLIQSNLSNLKKTTLLDMTHHYYQQKIITIVNRYNPGMDDALKRKIASKIREMNFKYSNLDVDLICATITHESAMTWNPYIVSPAGAIGLMQILPMTGIQLAREEGFTWNSIEDILVDPLHNITLGCRYLSMLIETYDLDGGLAAYNGGTRRAELWLHNGRAEGILHTETASYIPSILKIYEQFKHMRI